MRKLHEHLADARHNVTYSRATKFGDTITADHKVLNEDGESLNNQRYANAVQDLATPWIQSYHLGQNNYSFDALQAYCFGINIKL